MVKGNSISRLKVNKKKLLLVAANILVHLTLKSVREFCTMTMTKHLSSS
jgi:hypothetical protein